MFCLTKIVFKKWLWILNIDFEMKLFSKNWIFIKNEIINSTFKNSLIIIEQLLSIFYSFAQRWMLFVCCFFIIQTLGTSRSMSFSTYSTVLTRRSPVASSTYSSVRRVTFSSTIFSDSRTALGGPNLLRTASFGKSALDGRNVANYMEIFFIEIHKTS